MLDHLTDAQVARFKYYREEYIKWGLSTEPADKPEAESAIRDAYVTAKLAPPEKFIWLGSPFAGVVASWLLKNDKDISVLDDPNFIKNTKNWSQFRNELSYAGYGQHDASWLAFYAFFAEMGIEAAKSLEPMQRLMKSAGWWWPFKTVCVVTDRPEKLVTDNAGRLHNNAGPALSYRDGWAIYVWHGLRLPPDKSWIIDHPERITFESIMKESNVEIRRTMCEVDGFKAVMEVSRVVSEDVDVNGLPRRLLEATFDSTTIRMIEVQNGSLEPDGSRRKFILGAMPGDTPHDVVAASYGINPAKFREGVRT